MERHPERRRQFLGRDLADPVVAELQPLPGAAQHPVADQLFDALGGLALGQVRRPLDEREVELAPDHRGGRDQTPAPLGEALQALPDEGPHSGRQGQARAPDTVAPSRSACITSTTTKALPSLARHASSASRRPGRRELPGAQAPERGRWCRRGRAAPRTLRSSWPLSSSSSRVWRRSALSASSSSRTVAERQERDRMQAPAEEREQADAHLISPVEILQHDDERVPAGEAREELADRLEEMARVPAPADGQRSSASPGAPGAPAGGGPARPASPARARRGAPAPPGPGRSGARPPRGRRAGSARSRSTGRSARALAAGWRRPSAPSPGGSCRCRPRRSGPQGARGRPGPRPAPPAGAPGPARDRSAAAPRRRGARARPAGAGRLSGSPAMGWRAASGPPRRWRRIS